MCGLFSTWARTCSSVPNCEAWAQIAASLRSRVAADVDGGRHRVGRDAVEIRVDVGHRRAGVPPGAAHRLQRVDRVEEAPRRRLRHAAGRPEGGLRGPADGHVVDVGIEAVGIEGDHHLRLQVADDGQELPLQGGHLLVHQGPRVPPPDLDGEPRVVVAQPDRRPDPQGGAGPLQLALPQPPPGLSLRVEVRVDVGVDDLALLPAGGADEVDLMALGGGLRQGPSADEGLIVGVGANGQQFHLCFRSEPGLGFV